MRPQVKLSENEDDLRELRRERFAALNILPKRTCCPCKNEDCNKCCKGFVKYLRAYCRITEVHGIRYIFDDRSTTEKVFWLVVWLIFCACAVVLTRDLYEKYILMPVVISYAMMPKNLFELPFPVVTICAENRASRAMLNYSTTFNDIVDQKNVPPEILKRFEYMYQVCNHDYEEPVLNGPNFYNTDFYDQLGLIQLSLSEVFVTCTYRKEPFNCSELTRVITDEGLCFSFNNIDQKHIFRDSVMKHRFLFETVNKTNDWCLEDGFKDPLKLNTHPRRALWSGADHALEFVLRSSRTDFDGLCNAALRGFRVALSTAVELPSMAKYFFKVQPGMATTAEIRADLMTTMRAGKEITGGFRAFSSKVRMCYFVQERYLRYFKVYTQANCELECIANYTLMYCGCTPFFTPRENGTKICGIGKYGCVEEARAKAMKLERENTLAKKKEHEQKICDCMPVCTSLSFSYSSSATGWFWKEDPLYLKQFAAELNTTDPDKQFYLAKVKLYLHSEYFLQTERSEIHDAIDLLARFGGVINLFIGCSLITGVELIYFMTIKLIANKVKYKKFTGPEEELD